MSNLIKLILFFKNSIYENKITAFDQPAETTCSLPSYNSCVICGQSFPKVNLADDHPYWIVQHLVGFAGFQKENEGSEGEIFSYIVNSI